MSRNMTSDHYTRRTLYKPSILYRYEVNGRQYTADRVTLGVVVSSTLPLFAKRSAAKYTPGKEVVVHYDPEKSRRSRLAPVASAAHSAVARRQRSVLVGLGGRDLNTVTMPPVSVGAHFRRRKENSGSWRRWPISEMICTPHMGYNSPAATGTLTTL